MATTSALKKISFIFHLICFLMAAVLIGFGTYLYLNYATNEIGYMSAYAYISIGVIACVVFLFLCIGAIRENVCCTVTFIVFMILGIIAQAVLAFLLTNGDHNVGSNLANILDEAWENELKSAGAMSIYESSFECCGRASPQDYIVNDRLPPATCFANGDSKVVENLIAIGCRAKVEHFVTDLLHIFNWLAWVLIVLELIVTFLSCGLCNSIRNDRRRSFY
ncbi:protein late bloomer [Glossina fuscipes]|uniref:Tetraspanin n=2 Tax=Nemorhina TaxID=44051 RepID=A0A9C5ZGR8_9MUSC|nr:protein late bloomer [Glossina fuscipes]